MSRWPFETREFVDAGVFKYCMSPETSNRIIALMSEVEAHDNGAT